jgi:hypothetical protein
MSKTIRVRGHEVDAAALLAALHNRTRPRGMGMLHARGSMRRAEAVAALEARGWAFSFDYFYGRPLKVHARNGEINEASIALYERDAGAGAFADALEDALTMPADATEQSA